MQSLVCSSCKFPTLLWFLIILLGALVALYEEAEKPNNATEFVRRFMGASGPDSAEIETIKNELMVTRERFDELVKENDTLKEKLQKYESGERGQ
jgi:hypothetical protein